MPKRKATPDNQENNIKRQDTLPQNTSMPETFSFPSASSNSIVSWNVNSLTAALKKGFMEYIKHENPNILCLQETKLNNTSDAISKDIYPFQYFACSSAKKGYSGTAVFSKVEPLNVIYGIPGTDIDDEGRYITLEFRLFYLVTSYVPNAGQGLKRMDVKLEWLKQTTKFLNELQKTKDVVWTGDLNVAHTEIDLARPEGNLKTPGFTIEEREAFSLLLSECNLVDVWRNFHAEEREEGYTYYSYRFKCREKGIGWRLDYFVLAKGILCKVEECAVRAECYGASDHLPLYIRFVDNVFS